MKKSMRGYGFYMLILVIVLLAISVSDGMGKNGSSYGFLDYKNDLTAGVVKGVLIYQNEEAPTGEVRVVFKDDSVKRFYVTDTKAAEAEAYAVDIQPVISDISKPNWF